jgi:lactate dehydrogenase-like 2-hydroxyacid dehydrogenase
MSLRWSAQFCANPSKTQDQKDDSAVADTKDIQILVHGNLHAHAADRLKNAFDVIVGPADVAELAPETRARVRGIAVALGKGASVTPDFIDLFPNLEIMSSFGVGYDHVDAAYAGSAGVMVTNTPDVLTEEVADTAIGLLLNTVRELPKAEAWLRAGKWAGTGPYPLSKGSLRSRSVGIFGMGRIGQAIARRIEAFGLPVSYHNRQQIDGMNYTYYPSLIELAQNVDTLISIAPGGESTLNAVNADVLKALGTDGVFINIGRGSTVDEVALAAALADGTIMAAGLDVFAAEPKVPDGLLNAENACLLPHVGSASVHTRRAMADLVVDNLLSWFEQGNALTPVAETRSLKKTG